MGKLRPIGSEKLDGMDKINRIIEISRYKENIPNSINEDSSVEYKITLSDGKNYQIEKEKNGYVIKKTISESSNEYDYLEPMKNRKYYSSYSQAFKRLNLIAKEVNINEGYDRNISLFYESETDESKKYFLKVKSNEQSEPIPGVDTSIEEQSSPEAAPAPAPAPEVSAPTPAPAPEVASDEVALPEPEMDLDGEETEEEKVTIKTIQKLTGKLAQKLRAFSSDNEEEMSSNDVKYVINSILSALDLNSLEDDDRDEIIGKFEGEESEEDMDIESPEKPEYEPETEIEPEAEMGEDFNSDDAKDFIKDVFKEEDDLEMEPEYPRHRKPLVKFRKHNLDTNHADKVEEMFEGMFNESKVDNILTKYFKIEEKERQLIESKRRETKSTNENTKELVNRIKNLSENVSQEVASRKLISKHPNAKLLGKTKKSVLVFEVNDRKFRVSPKGGIL